MMEEIGVILNWFESNYEVIVALAAIVISVWSLHLQRKHNKLSAKPFLDFEYLSGGVDKPLELSIVNVGFGPALNIVLSLYDQGEYVETEELKFRDYMVEQAGPLFLENTDLHITNPSTLKSGQKQTICRLEGPDSREVHEEFIQRFKFELAYFSLYGEKSVVEFTAPV
jgi:hypothetical protein